jgi:lysozyme family protein
MAWDFERAFAHTMSKDVEGGYANAKNDSGGETYRGISTRSFPDWPGWPKVRDAVKSFPNLKGRKLWDAVDASLKDDTELDGMVRDFYLREFWTPLDGLPDLLRAKAFDTCINVGLRTGIKLMQKSIGVRADGMIGPATKARAKDSAVPLMCDLQAAYYKELARKKPSQKPFLAAWLKRAAWQPSR